MGHNERWFWTDWVDLDSKTDLRIQVKELPFEDAYLSKVVDDKKSGFTRMEEHDLFYCHTLFAAISLGCQPIISLYFHPLVAQYLALAATAIHCGLSEYAREMMAMIMSSQDEYQGTSCPSPLIRFTQDATALINHTFMCHLIPPGITPSQG